MINHHAATGGVSVMTERDAPEIVIFDLIGTLVDLEPVRRRMIAEDAPPATLKAWFARTLHTATCLTLLGEFAPFADIARTSLQTTLATVDVDPSAAEPILAPLAEGTLPAFTDAGDALASLNAADLSLYVLTNGSAEQTRNQLGSAELEAYFDGIVSVEEVRAYKPHPSTYQRVLDRAGTRPGQATFVAAHGWDAVGARAVGLDAIWISRSEKRWPFPAPEPPAVGDLRAAAARIAGAG
jgi:2-haloacid dehalogenase